MSDLLTDEDILVIEACSLLDTVLDINWRPCINLKALDLEDTFRCVLAQIGHHGDGLTYERAYTELNMRIFRDQPGVVRMRLERVFYDNLYRDAWRRALAS